MIEKTEKQIIIFDDNLFYKYCKPNDFFKSECTPQKPQQYDNMITFN